MLNYVAIDTAATFDVVTMDPDTGQITDADSVPVYDVFEDANDTPILFAQNTTKRTSKTGDYRGTFTCSVANGFDADKCYNVVVSATVTGTVSGNPITAKKVALTFKAGVAASTAGAVPATVAGAVGSVTGSVGGSVGSVLGSVGSVVGAVGSVTGGVTVTTNNDKTGYALTAAGIDGIWDELVGDSTLTARQALKVFLASLAGKLSGAASTTITIRNVADDTNRIIATVDADGNRTSVTLSV